MSRSARLLDLIQALRRRRHPVTAAELAAELGVSRRTLYRDVVTLQGHGAPIEGEAGLGYVLRPGYVLPPLMFSQTEVDAIILGLRFVRQRGDEELAAGAEDALAKIEAVLPSGHEDARRGNPLLAGPAGSAAGPHLTAIRSAIQAEQKLLLRYRDKSGEASERVIWPIAIGFFDAIEILGAWCEARADFRHFRFDRIVSLTRLSQTLPKRHRLLLAEWRLSQKLDHII